MNHPRIGYQQWATKDNQKTTSTVLFDCVESSWSQSWMKDARETKEGQLPSKRKVQERNEGSSLLIREWPKVKKMEMLVFSIKDLDSWLFSARWDTWFNRRWKMTVPSLVSMEKLYTSFNGRPKVICSRTTVTLSVFSTFTWRQFVCSSFSRTARGIVSRLPMQIWKVSGTRISFVGQSFG